MRKERYDPDKLQNNYGGDYECKQYDKDSYGEEWCHDEGNSNWDEFIKWEHIDKDNKLKCKGNRHNCMKLRQQWLTSLSDNSRNKYFKK